MCRVNPMAISSNHHSGQQIFVHYPVVITLILSLILSTANTVLMAQDTTLQVQIISNDNPVTFAEPSESELLARRMLSSESVNLVLNGSNLNRLAKKIQQALDIVRKFDPNLVSVSATPHFRPDVLLLAFENELKSAVSDNLTGQSGSVQFNTGFQAFDDLNRKLGLFAVTDLSHVNVNIFHFNKPINLSAAIEQYSTITGVRYAEPDEYLHLFEPTDIDIYHTDDTWHLIFTNPIGDLIPTPGDVDISYLRVRNGSIDHYRSELDCNDLPEFIPCPQIGQRD